MVHGRQVSKVSREVVSMCGRYAIFTEEDNEEIRQIINEVNERYKSAPLKPQFKTGEIFPTDTVPALYADATGKIRQDLFKWGFPGFSKNSSVIINARSETLDEKPAFRKLLAAGRCLLPASAFYEWKKENNKKEKFIITPSAWPVFYMAGLYNTFTGKDGKQFNAFVIITTQACSEMAHIHDRMPVIFTKGQETSWLAQDYGKVPLLKSALKPYSDPLHIRAC